MTGMANLCPWSLSQNCPSPKNTVGYSDGITDLGEGLSCSLLRFTMGLNTRFSVAILGTAAALAAVAHTAFVTPEDVQATSSWGAYNQVSLGEFEKYIAQEPTRVHDADPHATAIAIFARYTQESEGRRSESINIEYDWNGGAIATITIMGLADDSVAAERIRLDFKRDSHSIWELVWMGRQHQCQQGRGSQTWTTQACS